ncbi:uncharacterized protein LOC133824558 isoform X4 [Humulus lupulus]|uniref:uncharacterized protein LOC133824558 isoform X4 n=1 Tax=Humulus lupulus TaxID=3486 RepID=UPI002B40E43F|nr:uncharacterized protein LOC133824558 isoform X4 [Humulus lupulus]
MDDFCWGLEKQSSTLGEMRIASMATTSTFSISPLFGFGDGNVYVWSIRSGKEVVVLDFSKVNIIQLMHNKFMNQLQAKTLLKGYLRELRQLYKRTKVRAKISQPAMSTESMKRCVHVWPARLLWLRAFSKWLY